MMMLSIIHTGDDHSEDARYDDDADVHVGVLVGDSIFILCG